MNKKELEEYQALKREVNILDDKINKLCDRIEKVPVVAGKVQSTTKDFPYTPCRLSVDVADPKAADTLERYKSLKEKRRRESYDKVVEIEQFIESIPYSQLRQIFELYYIDGMTFRQVGEKIHQDHSWVRRQVNRYLEETEL